MSNWNDGRKAVLSRMWLEGSSSGDIAAALGKVSRNAVMGMVHRMGLMGSPEHAARSTAKRTGCCSPDWRKAAVDVSGADEGGAGAVVVESDAPDTQADAEAVRPDAPIKVLDIEAEVVSDTVPGVQRSAFFGADVVDEAPARRDVKRARPPRGARPTRPIHRMPLREVEAEPLPKVVISSGVMSSLKSIQQGTVQLPDAFAILKDLTGIAYDDRVPGHGLALVAIATVISAGDPRRVLSPRMSEQAVLRFMRRFAEKGLVIAGKPPAHWLESDDREFYDEMVKLGAV